MFSLRNSTIFYSCLDNDIGSASIDQLSFDVGLEESMTVYFNNLEGIDCHILEASCSFGYLSLDKTTSEWNITDLNQDMYSISHLELPCCLTVWLIAIITLAPQMTTFRNIACILPRLLLRILVFLRYHGTRKFLWILSSTRGMITWNICNWVAVINKRRSKFWNSYVEMFFKTRGV